MKNNPVTQTANATKFRDLSIGDTFDFVNDATPASNSYFARCTKTSARGYSSTLHDKLKVGTINAKVFHVQTAR
jgi:hypothetical protein